MQAEHDRQLARHHEQIGQPSWLQHSNAKPEADEDLHGLHAAKPEEVMAARELVDNFQLGLEQRPQVSSATELRPEHLPQRSRLNGQQVREAVAELNGQPEEKVGRQSREHRRIRVGQELPTSR